MYKSNQNSGEQAWISAYNQALMCEFETGYAEGNFIELSTKS